MSLHYFTKKVCQLILVLGLSILVGCAEKPNPNVLIVGTIAGPETDLVEVAQTIAHTRYGLTVKIIEFGDYNLPNAALQDGTLDINIFQHLPYLEDAIKSHHYQLEVAGKTFLYPTAIYSNKINTLKAVPQNAIVAIPNDPSNELRALLLLQHAGLITLNHNNSASLHDIRQNPKNLQFRELDAAQLPRVLADVDLAVINTNFAILSGLNPNHDALFVEKKNSPYANLIVIKQSSNKKEQINHFVEAMHSPEVQKKAKTMFSDAAIPAW